MDVPPWWKTAVAAVFVLPLLVLAFVVTREPPSSPEINATAQPTDSSNPSPDASPSSSPTETSSPEDVPEVPEVQEARRANFAKGDSLPDGAQIFDLGRNESGLELLDGRLTHGAPTAPNAVSYLEAELDEDVLEVGVRVKFASEDSGGVAITAWQDSITEARQAGGRLPATGLRLAIARGSWRLVVFDDEQTVLGRGEYEAAGRAKNFSLVRSGDQLWVVDPSGKVEHFEDPQIEALAGPWVSWELYELKTTQTPASVITVWAG